MQTSKCYKLHLLRSLTSEYLDAFLRLLVKENEVYFTLILRCKLFPLLHLHSAYFAKYNPANLKKIATLSIIIPLEDVVAVLDVVDIEGVTKCNIRDLSKFVKHTNLFARRQVQINWGPGNNGCARKNAVEHCKKHALYNTEYTNTEEYLEWERILADDELYTNYSIKHFYAMRDVIVHSNGRGVYLSGFYFNVFIVGRYA